MDRNEEDLRILSICYYALASIALSLVCISAIYLAFGILALVGGVDQGDSEFVALGGVFLSVGFLLCFFLGILSLFVLYTGRCLSQHRWYAYCFIMAVICSFFPPPGTVLGVFTIVVLYRPEVKRLFGRV